MINFEQVSLERSISFSSARHILQKAVIHGVEIFMKTNHTVCERHGAFNELKRVVRKFGLHIYTDPMCNGTDFEAFLVSDSKLTKTQVRQKCRENWIKK